MLNIIESTSSLRIALLGDFKHDTLRNTQIITRKLQKGLVRNGHDVLPFSFRNNMMEASPIPSKRVARKIGKKRVDQFCVQLLEDYQPHLIILTSYRDVDAETLDQLKKALPETKILGWYGDTLDGVPEKFMGISRRLDFFLATGAGELLQNIGQELKIPCGFMPNPCDPDLECAYPASAGYQSDLLFTGKFSHKGCGRDSSRADLLQTLLDDYGLEIFGAKGSPAVLGLEYFRRISNAKIALSINASNDIRLYHSDRLINFVACGTFVVAKYVPDSELLFEDKKHLCYFKDEKECLELIDYYLAHEAERVAIAQAGMAHAHECFNGQRIARDIIDFVRTGHYDEIWSEIILP